MQRMNLIIGVATASLVALPAMGGYNVVNGPTAPQYGTLVTWDEGIAPTGTLLNGDEYLPTHGITFNTGAGDGGVIDDWDTAYGGWGLGTDLTHWGNFGTHIQYNQDITESSLQIWNNGTDPFFGGISIFIFNDGVELTSFFFIPAWGGFGDSWYNITADGGDTFDEIRIVDWDFASVGVFTDNISWTATVPSPGALALLALAGLVSRRRR